VVHCANKPPIYWRFVGSFSKRGSEGRPALRSSYEGASNHVKPIKVNQQDSPQKANP
jgi:hypothetical protein